LGAEGRIQEPIADLISFPYKTSEQPPQAEAKERIVRKTIEVIERSLTPIGKTFTTPKIRRKKTGHRSVRRVAHELVDSWYPDTEVCYEAMELKLKTKFERFSRQTVLAYLGRLETRQVQRIDQQIRYRKSGTTTFKDHTFTRRLPRKKGYLELFGLATLFKNKKGEVLFRLHHQRQSTLNEDSAQSGTPLQRVHEELNEESSPSKIFLSVIKDSLREGEEAVLEVSADGDGVYRDTEKREYI